MLRKVLKYDLDAIWLPWVIMSATALILSVFSGISLRALMTFDPMTAGQHFENWMWLAIMVLCITVFAVVVYGALSTIMVLVRYYQNFFTDEGYLTFTLPVKRSTLLNSKLLVAFIWNVATTLVIILALVIAFLIAPAGRDGTGTLLVTIWRELITILSAIFAFVDGWFIAHIIVAVILVIIASILSTMVIFACMTIGCVLVKKLKVLISILIYYFVSSAMSLGANLLTWVYTFLLELAYSTPESISYSVASLISLFALVIFGMMMIVMCVVAYNFILNNLEHKLNLA